MRQLAWVQGVMLLIAIVLTVMFKNGMGGSESMMFWSWLAHSVVFLLYVAMLGWAMGRRSLSAKHSWIGLLVALIPFGSLIFERMILRHSPMIR